jgi:hypothetical protein
MRAFGYELLRRSAAAQFRCEAPLSTTQNTRFADAYGSACNGYLADRLARLGVEKALADAGAEPGDTVLIGDLDDAVVFDWDPTLIVGSGHAPGPRGTDWRLEG